MDKLTKKYKIILENSEIYAVVEIKKILFIKLKRDCTLKEAQKESKDLQTFLTNDLIDSVTFVDTPNKFRIGD